MTTTNRRCRATEATTPGVRRMCRTCRLDDPMMSPADGMGTHQA